MELMKLMEDWKGYASFNERGIRHTDAEITAFNNLLSNAAGDPAHRHEYKLREVMTTSDFPNLFGDVLDRQVLASYKAVDPVWKAFVKMSTVRDFKDSYRFAITGGDQYLAEVAEKGEYLASDRDENKYTLAVKKYGRQFDISWESLINDDLGALKDTPERFARAGIRTEHRITSILYAYDQTTTAGADVHTFGGPLYSTFAGEINKTAGALTIGYLEQGLEAMAAFTDANGEPIQNRAKYLVVPPALELTGRQILTSTEKRYTGGAGGTAWPTTNVVSNYGLTLIVDPYLPIASLVNEPTYTNSANTAWYLFADPNDIAAIEVAHLSGHERPEICMKASDKVTVGGGAIGPMSGDFATDNVLYRVRLVFGGVTQDWRATYMGGATSS